LALKIEGVRIRRPLSTNGLKVKIMPLNDSVGNSLSIYLKRAEVTLIKVKNGEFLQVKKALIPIVIN